MQPNRKNECNLALELSIIESSTSNGSPRCIFFWKNTSVLIAPRSWQMFNECGIRTEDNLTDLRHRKYLL